MDAGFIDSTDGPAQRPCDVSAGAGGRLPAAWRRAMARRPAAVGSGDGRDVLAEARRALDQVDGRLAPLVRADRQARVTARDGCLASIADLLDACAVLWRRCEPRQALCHDDLGRALERRLASSSASALTATAVAAHVRRAGWALDSLERRTAPRVEALERFAEAVVALGAIGVDAVLGDLVRAAPLSGGRSDADRVRAEIREIVGQLDATPAAPRPDGDRVSVGWWLSQALLTRIPPAERRRAGDPHADRTLAAEALLAVRAAWLGLARCEARLACALERQAGDGVPLPGSADRAARLAVAGLLDGSIAAWAADDLEAAERRQRVALAALAHACLDGLDGDASRTLAAAEAATEALAATIAVLWRIDRRLEGGPNGDSTVVAA